MGGYKVLILISAVYVTPGVRSLGTRLPHGRHLPMTTSALLYCATLLRRTAESLPYQRTQKIDCRNEDGLPSPFFCYACMERELQLGVLCQLSRPTAKRAHDALLP